MQIIALCLVVIVGVEHLGIMLLEMFGRPTQQARAFDLNLEFIEQAETQVMLKNQGIYNGMLGLALLISFLTFNGRYLLTVQLLFLAIIVIVALYGGCTATRKIWLIQMLPALLAAIAVSLLI
ncbi:DUF1304 domain-containing protein [Limosilactobacillus caecicola]|uniref:DUF1304 domain-containing protein n=1 Tax=Limosilactobacillus caecicola TaxID=2941332 RepID=UPI00203C5195|nr:DUF1304 domain-containing protein [Limosilactobacillus caecicola]